MESLCENPLADIEDIFGSEEDALTNQRIGRKEIVPRVRKKRPKKEGEEISFPEPVISDSVIPGLYIHTQGSPQCRKCRLLDRMKFKKKKKKNFFFFFFNDFFSGPFCGVLPFVF